MNKMVFDIETVPAHEERHTVLLELHQKKVDDGKKIVEFEEFISKTSFDGGFGQIVCISYAINNDSIKTISGDEKEILRKFWEIAKSVDLFIGFNVFDFDLRFIYQRSMVLGIKPTKDLNFARYRNFPIYDVMREWNKWNMQQNTSLNDLAYVFGFPSSKGGEIEGKDVAQAYKDGRIEEICKYCEKDVELTRKIYNKMQFEDFEDSPFF